MAILCREDDILTVLDIFEEGGLPTLMVEVATPENSSQVLGEVLAKAIQVILCSHQHASLSNIHGHSECKTCRGSSSGSITPAAHCPCVCWTLYKAHHMTLAQSNYTAMEAGTAYTQRSCAL